MAAKISTVTIPNSKFTGRRAGLQFADGVAYVNHDKGEELNSGQRFNLERWGYVVDGPAAEVGATAAKRKGGKANGEE